jgi:acyl-CoA synthetase (AMP-forming)/AMP-acid ligase II
MSAGVAARIREIFSIDPTAGAVEFQGRWYSWEQFARAVDAIDNLLREKGLGEDAPVGIVLRNQLAHLAAVTAVLMTRRTLVMINPFQKAGPLCADVRALRVPAVLASQEDWGASGFELAVRESGALGVQLGMAGVLSAAPRPGLSEPAAGTHYRAAMPGIAIEMLTSGTTGPAKRIPLAYKQFEHALLDALHYERDHGQAPKVRLRKGVVFIAQPLVHIGGIWAAYAAFLAGRPVVLIEKFNVAEWHAAVLRHRPKLVSLVPSAIRMVLDARIPKEDLAGIIAMRTGTAPVPLDLRDQFEQTYNIPILDVYGATEFAGAVAGWTLSDYRRFGGAKRGSTGRAHPGCELRVVDPDTGALLDPGNVGLLEVRGGQLDKAEGWRRTTDLAMIDSDGFLFIKGRSDNAINRGGFKILPEDVARVLMEHPAVKEAVVTGVADARLGAVPVAVVELADGAEVTEQQLVEFARQHLIAYQVPARVMIVKELPRTPSLKVSLVEVRSMLESAS